MCRFEKAHPAFVHFAVSLDYSSAQFADPKASSSGHEACLCHRYRVSSDRLPLDHKYASSRNVSTGSLPPNSASRDRLHGIAMDVLICDAYSVAMALAQASGPASPPPPAVSFCARPVTAKENSARSRCEPRKSLALSFRLSCLSFSGQFLNYASFPIAIHRKFQAIVHSRQGNVCLLEFRRFLIIDSSSCRASSVFPSASEIVAI